MVLRFLLPWSGAAFLILLVLLFLFLLFGGAEFHSSCAVSSSFRVELLSRLLLDGGEFL